MDANPRDRGSVGSPDRILARTEIVTVGAFRCEIGHPMFRDSGPIRQPCFVFPRTAVTIAHPGLQPFVADPTVVTLYNRGQRYERAAVSPRGDRCDWFGVEEPVLREAVRPLDRRTADDAVGPIRHVRARSEARLYLRQRAFVRFLEQTPPLDPMLIDETVMDLLAHVLANAYGVPSAPVAFGHRKSRADLVEAARRLLAQRFRERLTLGRLAGELGCSPFHLCRSFRGVTGLTLHRHLTELRLRSALERLDDGVDLTRVALDVGYSSHSHFTAAFRQVFGVPPSAAMRRARIR